MPNRSRLSDKLSFSARAELWRRWRDGENLSEIARALERSVSTIHGYVAHHGGISPRPRKRSHRQLSFEERETISRGLEAGQSFRTIASKLGRSPSTGSREVRRHGGRKNYRAQSAERQAWRSALRPKACKLSQNGRLRRAVAKKLAGNWSPEQIAGWLNRKYINEPSMNISHETIYKSVYFQTRGVLKKELVQHLRRKRMMRQGKKATKKKRTSSIQNELTIADRPAIVDERTIPGHWEGDLIAGSNNTYVATLVERKTRFTMLAKVSGKDAMTVRKALIKKFKRLPVEVRKSLTWDRGSELAEHKAIAVAADIQIYFCDPASPWQRGTNENTNGLLRQYMPKKTDLSVHSQAELNRIARELNGRPRKTLEFETPAEVFSRALP